MKSALYSPRSSTRTTLTERVSAAHPGERRCRACRRDGLRPILNLGALPLANALLTRDELDAPETRIPLVLAFCPGCTLVQITETVPAETLFREYLYFSSNSETVVREAEKLAQRMIAARSLTPGSLVMEIASNDGYLLQFYERAGIPVLGIEPARNIARAAREKGIRTISQFFGRELAARLARNGARADVVHANNVLAHVSELDGFLAGLRCILKSGGLVVIEVPYLRDMVERIEFDTIYHEHLAYFSVASLEALLTSHGLAVVDVERLAIHGGSLRVYAAQAGSAAWRSEAVAQLAAEEAARGVARQDFLEGFAQRVRGLRERLVTLLLELKAQGRRLAAYGASAKGTTLLNYCGIGADVLDFVVDRSAAKQGLYTPGTHLPIGAPDRLLEEMPDYVLLLTWNFADEILRQQDEYRRRGGRFILPIPEPRVI